MLLLASGWAWLVSSLWDDQHDGVDVNTDGQVEAYDLIFEISVQMREMYRLKDLQ